jgi:hypothetical protein
MPWQTVFDKYKHSFPSMAGMLLWALSALLTADLFLSLSDGTAGKSIILILTAVALESAKIITWRRAGLVRILACILIGLSALASLGAALQTVENSKGRFFSVSLDEIHSSTAYQNTLSEVHSLDCQIKSSVSRLDNLPPDYVTASVKLSDSISALRDRRQVLLDELVEMEKTTQQGSSASDMVALIAQTIGIPAPTLLLVLLLLISGCIEAGALILCLPETEMANASKKAINESNQLSSKEITKSDDSASSHPSYQLPITPDEFLLAAKEGSDLPYIAGRDRTAQKLGLPAGQAKRIVRELIRSGKIVPEGKRLRLVI